MKILVLNCGSSSVKYAVLDTESGDELSSGQVENIGAHDGRLKIKWQGEKKTEEIGETNHTGALQKIVEFLDSVGIGGSSIDGIGHRVVSGGEKFSESVLINDIVLQGITDCIQLAPLHNPAHIEGISVARKLFGDTPQVAVFDSAFHQSMPRKAYLYPIPQELYKEYGVRRYGYHGTSHRFVVTKAAQLIGVDLSHSGFISAHLGNGCSATAIKNGQSVDTTMGLTPLEGLVMGTRSGDVDPALYAYLKDVRGWDIATTYSMLNKQSGLRGVSGQTHDMRTLEQLAMEGNSDAALAIDIFVSRLAKAIGALSVALDSLTALIFTGGIGENQNNLRKKVLEQLNIMGFVTDDARNAVHGRDSNGIITTDTSSCAMVVETNEELLIAQDTAAIIGNS